MKRLILLALLKCDGQPLTQTTLYDAVRLMSRPARPTDDDILYCLRGVESDGYVSGATVDLVGTTWTLTAKGTHKARQLQ